MYIHYTSCLGSKEWNQENNLETFTLANTELTKVKHFFKKIFWAGLSQLPKSKKKKKKSKKLFQNACIVLTASPTPPSKCFHQAVNNTPSESQGNRLSDRLGGSPGAQKQGGGQRGEPRTFAFNHLNCCKPNIWFCSLISLQKYMQVKQRFDSNVRGTG